MAPLHQQHSLLGLWVREAAGPTMDAPSSSSGDKPFPWAPVLSLCLCGFATAFNQTMLSPLIPFFVVDTGMVSDPRQPGKYAGYLTASAQVGRLFTSIAWGRYSDVHGRKTVLSIGLFSVAVTSLLFGVTLNFWLAVCFRFAGGAMDFTFGIVKTYVAEGIPEQHRSRAMSYTGATWGTALICGPAAGGLLAEPAVQYPQYFASDGLFSTLPYLLPCMVTSVVSVVALVLSMLTLTETVPDATGLCKGKQKGEAGAANTIGSSSDQEDEPADGKETERLLGDLDAGDAQPQSNSGSSGDKSSNSSSREEESHRHQFGRFFSERKPALAMAYYTLLIMIEFADEVLFSLYAAAPRLSGGLGFGAGTTGQIMGVCGALVIATQICVYLH